MYIKLVTKEGRFIQMQVLPQSLVELQHATRFYFPELISHVFCYQTTSNNYRRIEKDSDLFTYYNSLQGVQQINPQRVIESTIFVFKTAYEIPGFKENKSLRKINISEEIEEEGDDLPGDPFSTPKKTEKTRNTADQFTSESQCSNSSSNKKFRTKGTNTDSLMQRKRFLSEHDSLMNPQCIQLPPKPIRLKLAHPETSCAECGTSPIEGPLYRSLIISTLFLCGKCENSYDPKHPFVKIKVKLTELHDTFDQDCQKLLDIIHEEKRDSNEENLQTN